MENVKVNYIFRRQMFLNDVKSHRCVLSKGDGAVQSARATAADNTEVQGSTTRVTGGWYYSIAFNDLSS